MRKGTWQEIGSKKRMLLKKTGGGIHTGLPAEEIPDGMAADMYNLSSRSYPQLRPRAARIKGMPDLPAGTLRYFGLILGNTPGAVVDQTLYTLQNDTWTSCGTLFTGAESRVFAVDYMDYTVFADGTECKKYDGTAISKVGGTNTGPTNAAFPVSHAWHLFTASTSDSYLRYSAVEDIDDWTAPLNAGRELVETGRGAYGSALYAYGGHVLYFKKSALFELYGTDPVNFSLMEISGDIGCVSQGSLVEIDGVLYFVGMDAVYRYDGGARPKRISFPIQRFMDNLDTDRCTDIVAGSDGTRYYLSLPQKENQSCLLTYDTRIAEWFVEDETEIFAFSLQESTLFGATRAGEVFAFNSKEEGEDVTWSYTSKPYLCENSLHQNWHRLYIRAAVPQGAHCTVYLSPWCGGEGFVRVAEVTKSGITQIEIPPRLWDAPQIRIKLCGCGDITIPALEFTFRGRERSYG
ncbi:MAG: hypothetical protein PUB07_02570 [Clostridia bacterium]|nr:hypothetical protein [Clostridia bacterium]